MVLLLLQLNTGVLNTSSRVDVRLERHSQDLLVQDRTPFPMHTSAFHLVQSACAIFPIHCAVFPRCASQSSIVQNQLLEVLGSMLLTSNLSEPDRRLRWQSVRMKLKQRPSDVSVLNALSSLNKSVCSVILLVSVLNAILMESMLSSAVLLDPFPVALVLALGSLAGVVSFTFPLTS